MTTPQRALELAETEERHINHIKNVIELFPKSDLVDDHIRDIQECSDRAKIFRHYAEIMQAEPVAVLHTDWADTYLKIFTGRLYGDDKALIIKPEPLK